MLVGDKAEFIVGDSHDESMPTNGLHLAKERIHKSTHVGAVRLIDILSLMRTISLCTMLEAGRIRSRVRSVGHICTGWLAQ